MVRSGPEQLTEVLTSDLVRPVPRAAAASGDTSIRDEFVHGVRERLLTLGYRDRTVEVQHLVEYELAHDVEAVRNLTLRVKDPRNASYERVTPAAEPYLRVNWLSTSHWAGRTSSQPRGWVSRSARPSHGRYVEYCSHLPLSPQDHGVRNV